MFASFESNGEAKNSRTPRRLSLFRRGKERKNIADRKIHHAQAALWFRLFRHDARDDYLHWGKPRSFGAIRLSLAPLRFAQPAVLLIVTGGEEETVMKTLYRVAAAVLSGCTVKETTVRQVAASPREGNGDLRRVRAATAAARTKAHETLRKTLGSRRYTTLL